MALRIGTSRAFNKAGPDVEKARDPVLVFIQGTTNLFGFVEHTYFESLSALRVGPIAKCYAPINSNIPLVAPAQLIIIQFIV